MDHYNSYTVKLSNTYTDHIHIGEYKKPALRKLCAKVDLDQEEGEVTNHTCMDL